MKPALIVAIVVFVAVSLSGCGTVCNLAGGVVHPDREPRVYGGVLRDWEIIEGVVRRPPPDTQTIDDAKGMVALLAIAVADPIFSFAGDTLTLPITVPLQARRTTASKSNDEAR